MSELRGPRVPGTEVAGSSSSSSPATSGTTRPGPGGRGGGSASARVRGACSCTWSAGAAGCGPCPGAGGRRSERSATSRWWRSRDHPPWGGAGTPASRVRAGPARRRPSRPERRPSFQPTRGHAGATRVAGPSDTIARVARSSGFPCGHKLSARARPARVRPTHLVIDFGPAELRVYSGVGPARGAGGAPGQAGRARERTWNGAFHGVSGGMATV